jgi:hypothetical protein
MTPDDPERPSRAPLTPPMREALARLCDNKVWADKRSVDALIRRGLVEHRGSGHDALIGNWNCWVPTPEGRALNELIAGLRP